MSSALEAVTGRVRADEPPRRRDPAHSRHGTVIARILTLAVLVTSVGTMRAGVESPNPVYAAACSSTADCLSKMTLDEKIGQMTQVAHNYLASPSDITTYNLGSLLSGGGGGPNGGGGTASQWADMYD